MQTITKETKGKVVKLHIQDGRTISSLAAEYGVCHATVSNWNRKSANATYESSLPGNDVEQWKLPANLPHGTNVKYEVRCTMNGVTYIDNNFGYYYTNY